MSTRVHHLNCCTMTPPSEQMVNGRGGWLGSGHMVAHCLLLETEDGLVLVDSGIGTRDVADPRRLGAFFVNVVRPRLSVDETALRQVDKLGYRASDVRHIVVTHLDVDHAGGLSDFPSATVHVYRQEHAAALRPTWRDRERYRRPHFEHGPLWQLHDVDGERFMGLSAVRAIVEPEVLLVPIAGHSHGHAGVAVRGPDGWLFHCGDAYFNKAEMQSPPSCPPGPQLFQTVVATDNRTRLANQKRLRTLRREHAGEVTLFSAHDGDELAAFLD